MSYRSGEAREKSGDDDDDDEKLRGMRGDGRKRHSSRRGDHLSLSLSLSLFLCRVPFLSGGFSPPLPRETIRKSSKITSWLLRPPAANPKEVSQRERASGETRSAR